MQRQNLRQIQLPDSCNYVFLKNNTVHKTTSVECYYQCGVQSTRDNAIVELFCQVINESSFNVLRTQEQLGYIVASGVRNFGGAQGVRLIVQSDKSPAFLDERIENFLRITRVGVFLLFLCLSLLKKDALFNNTSFVVSLGIN